MSVENLGTVVSGTVVSIIVDSSSWMTQYVMQVDAGFELGLAPYWPPGAQRIDQWMFYGPEEAFHLGDRVTIDVTLTKVSP